MTTTTGIGPATGSTLTPVEAESLIFRECRLLDDLRYEEWLDLFTEDGLYWLPIADGEPEEAESLVSIIYDDAERRAERVFRTLHTPVLDQNPRSRTVHMAGNVEVLGVLADGTSQVRCSMIVAELRPGGERQVGLNKTRVYAGRCEYRLRREDDGWRIRLKKLLLLDADQPLYNLTFIL